MRPAVPATPLKALARGGPLLVARPAPFVHNPGSIMRTFLPRLLSLLLAASAAHAGRSPTSQQRLPLQNDFDRCALLAADHGNENIQGRVRLQLLLRPSGNVYGAYVHSTEGVNDKRFFACLTGYALFWRFPPLAVDGARPYEIAIVPGGTEMDFNPLLYQAGIDYSGQGRASVFMPAIDDVPVPRPLEKAVAQSSLDVAEWATGAERGLAENAVQRYDTAIPMFRQALAADPNDPVALRGLAEALAETGGDLTEARAVAEQLASVRPGSVVGAEAMLRVCLAARDDLCVFRSFNAGSHAPDVGPRARFLAELQPLAEAAAARLNAQARARSKADPCAGLGDQATLLQCLVRSCLDEQVLAVAAEKKGKAGAWKFAPVGADALIASRPLGEGLQEPRWVVSGGASSVKIKPANAAAREISSRPGRCSSEGSAVAREKGDLEQPLRHKGE